MNIMRPIAMAAIATYTHLGVTPLWLVIFISVIMFAGITARMVAAQALLSAVPEARDRGTFMSINSSVQQVSGGIAAIVAGLIVVQAPDGHLDRYGLLGWVVCGVMLTNIVLIGGIDRMIKSDTKAGRAQT